MGTILLYGWGQALESLAVVAIVIIGICLMLGFVKPGHALKYMGASLGILIVLMILPGILVSTWSQLASWQKLGIAAVLVSFMLLLRRQPRRRRTRQE